MKKRRISFRGLLRFAGALMALAYAAWIGGLVLLRFVDPPTTGPATGAARKQR